MQDAPVNQPVRSSRQDDARRAVVSVCAEVFGAGTEQARRLASQQLGALLRTELEERESLLRADASLAVLPVAASGVGYYLRRREADRAEALASARLANPGLWAKICGLGVDEAKELERRVGIELLACAARGLAAEELVSWLGRLGGSEARAVAERLAAPATVGVPVAATVRGHLERLGQARRGEAAAGLGRRTLASLWQALPGETRRELVSGGRTILPSLLDRTPALPEALAPAGAVIVSQLLG